MSFPELLAELPKLTPVQRRELVLRLVEMDTTKAEAEDIAACELSAALGFGILEQMEAEDRAS
jgi:hypothetical protein